MGKQSTRENKTIYQLCREEKNSPARKQVSWWQEFLPPGLKKLNTKHRSRLLTTSCRWRTATNARIFAITTAPINAPSGSATFRSGSRRTLQYYLGDNCLSQWNQSTHQQTDPDCLRRKISDDEIKDFAFISQKLDEISLAVDSLNLWVDKTASENDLNVTLLREEKNGWKTEINIF